MAALQLVRSDPSPYLPVAAKVEGFAMLPDYAKDEAQRRYLLIKPGIDMVRKGASVRSVARFLFERLPSSEQLSRPTLGRWLQAMKESDDLTPLAPKWKGKQRKEKGWELRAQQLFKRESHPDCGDVADWLREEGWKVTVKQVRHYIDSLPTSETHFSRKRLGANYHRNNVAPKKVRDVSDLSPGEAWVADGHKIKVISQPAPGQYHRLELTPILDVACNYLYGFWVAHAESAEDTVYAFCSVARSVGGFPVWFYTDVGPGFDNARTKVLFDHAGTTHRKAWPGMCSSKGFGEGFMHLLNKRFSKRFESFCGDDRTDDVIARFRTKHKRGQIEVPTDDEVISALEAWRGHYNNQPQPYSDRLNAIARKEGKTHFSPADAMAKANFQPLNMNIADLLRPEVEVGVRSSTVRFENRFYRAAFLADYDGERVKVQYDRHDERIVWVFDLKGRFVGEAELVEKTPWAKENVAADAREKSRLAAVRRKQVQIDRINESYNTPIAPAEIDLAALVAPRPAPAISGGEQILNRGNSLAPPPVPTIVLPTIQPVNESTLARLREQAEAPSLPIESPESRFALWLRLSADPSLLDANSAGWKASYESTSEFHSRRRLHELTNQESPL